MAVAYGFRSKQSGLMIRICLCSDKMWPVVLCVIVADPPLYSLGSDMLLFSDRTLVLGHATSHFLPDMLTRQNAFAMTRDNIDWKLSVDQLLS